MLVVCAVRSGQEVYLAELSHGVEPIHHKVSGRFELWLRGMIMAKLPVVLAKPQPSGHSQSELVRGDGLSLSCELFLLPCPNSIIVSQCVHCLHPRCSGHFCGLRTKSDFYSHNIFLFIINILNNNNVYMIRMVRRYYSILSFYHLTILNNNYALRLPSGILPLALSSSSVLVCLAFVACFLPLLAGAFTSCFHVYFFSFSFSSKPSCIDAASIQELLLLI